jgi:AcrR family transcriptional regulator
MPKANDQPTRNRILEAAVAEIAEKGWGGLRTRSLAQRAAVNKALVHYHFRSMDNLRIESAAHVLSSAIDEAALAVLEAPTVAEGIRNFGAFLDALDPNEPSSVVFMETMLLVPREPRLEEIMLQMLSVYEEALAERIRSDVARGALPADTDVSGLTTALTALLDGLGLHAYMRPAVDFQPAAEALATLLEATALKREK